MQVCRNVAVTSCVVYCFVSLLMKQLISPTALSKLIIMELDHMFATLLLLMLERNDSLQASFQMVLHVAVAK